MKFRRILADLRMGFDISQSLHAGAAPACQHLTHVIEADLAFCQHLCPHLRLERMAVDHLEGQLQAALRVALAFLGHRLQPIAVSLTSTQTGKTVHMQVTTQFA